MFNQTNEKKKKTDPLLQKFRNTSFIARFSIELFFVFFLNKGYIYNEDRTSVHTFLTFRSHPTLSMNVNINLAKFLHRKVLLMAEEIANV